MNIIGVGLNECCVLTWCTAGDVFSIRFLNLALEKLVDTYL